MTSAVGLGMLSAITSGRALDQACGVSRLLKLGGDSPAGQYSISCVRFSYSQARRRFLGRVLGQTAGIEGRGAARAHSRDEMPGSYDSCTSDLLAVLRMLLRPLGREKIGSSAAHKNEQRKAEPASKIAVPTTGVGVACGGPDSCRCSWGASLIRDSKFAARRPEWLRGQQKATSRRDTRS
eukprot:2491843-Rhodomonas_salina.2